MGLALATVALVGVASGGASPPVVGGQAAEQGRWPSAAAIDYGGVTNCSGVLVHERLALTAGHCDSEALSHVILNRADLDSDQGERIEVLERHAYPEAFSSFDVTLLVLAEPAQTPPAQLMLGCASSWLSEGAQAQVVGYGNTEADGGGPTRSLHEAQVSVVDAACEDASADCNPSAMPDGELIAGGEGSDSCLGDSGGPLYLWGPEGWPVLAGTTSRAALPATQTCGDGGIYVRLDAVADWIEQTSGLSLAEPDCQGWENTPPQLGGLRAEVAVGEVIEVALEVVDPDSWQTLELQVLDAAGVSAELDGRLLRVEGLEPGSGFVSLQVSDGLATGQARIDLDVLAVRGMPWVEAEPLSGCSSRPRTASWILTLLALLAYRSSQPWVRSSAATRSARTRCPDTDRWQSPRNRSGSSVS